MDESPELAVFDVRKLHYKLVMDGGRDDHPAAAHPVGLGVSSGVGFRRRIAFIVCGGEDVNAGGRPAGSRYAHLPETVLISRAQYDFDTEAVALPAFGAEDSFRLITY